MYVGGANMPVNKETLKYRKEHNLCPRDGRPNAQSRKMCESCLVKFAAKTERHRQQKIKAGLCTNCGKNPPIGSSRLCSGCKDKTSIYLHNAYTKRYNYRKSMNQCTICGDKAVRDESACQKCLDQQSSIKKNKYQANSAQNLCIQCGKNIGDLTGKRCQTCIEKRNEWYQGSTTQVKDKVRRDEHREAVLKHYGNKCAECCESEPMCLAIDHIHGDGNIHRKKIGKYGSGFFKWLVYNNFPE